MDIFKLVGSIFIKTEESEKAIDETTKKVQNMASTIGEKMTVVGDKMSSVGTKLLPVSVAIGGLGVSAVKASAEVKAMNSQFEQTFGSMQSEASDAMNRVATESGILQTRLQGVGTSIYAFAKSSGADSAEAMSLMETALRATADASAYYDRSLEETSESLMSFLKGNFANDAQLGVSCTETTRNAKAMELFGQKYNDLSEIQKQQTLLKMVTDAQALSGAMGQASRESDGFENVMGNLKESVKMLGAEFGEVLLPTVINFIQGLTGLIQKFSEMDDGTKKLIVTIAGIVAGVAPVLIIVGNVISAVGSVMTAVSGMTGVIKTGVTIVKGLGTALGAVASPVGIVIAVIGALVAGFIYLWNNCEGFREFWIDLWNNIKEIASQVVDAVVNFFTNLWSNITNIASNIAEAVSSAWEGIKTTASNIWNSVADAVTSTWENMKTTASNIWNSITEAVSNAWDTICNIVQVAGMFLGEIIGLMFDIITLPFRFIWENCKEVVLEAWDSIKETVSEKFTAVKDKVTEIGGSIKDKCSEVFGNVKDKVSTVWGAIKQTTTDRWNEMQVSYEEGGGGIAGITEVWFDTVKNSVCNTLDFISSFTGINLDGLKTTFTDTWFTIRNNVVDVLYNLQTAIPEVWESIKTWLTSTLDAIKTKFEETWENIKTAVSNAVTGIKDKVSETMTAIKETLTAIWDAIKTFVSDTMDSIKENISSTWENIKSNVETAVDNIKSGIESGLNTAKEIVSGILDAIKEKFTSIFEDAKEIVSSAIDYIKGLFDFEWSLPHLKLPHFTVSGEFSLNPPSTPTFGIEWYKHGGVMLDPTIFGFNGNKAMVGGEAGAEAIAPVDILLGYIRTAVAEQNVSLIECLKDSIDSLGSKLSNRAEGDIVIPVYIGDTMIDDIIVSSKKNVRLRSGGLTSV